MVFRWRCPHCEFTGWSPVRQNLAREIKNHLFNHDASHLARRSFQFEWTCPHCDANEVRQDKTFAVKRFREHLYSHAEPGIESETHVADEIERRGSILVLRRPDSPEAENARIHFLSVADCAVFVGGEPLAQLELFRNGRLDWPQKTVFLTTSDTDSRKVPDLAPQQTTVDIIEIPNSFAPGTLGQMIARILTREQRRHDSLSLAFDAISPILDEYELQEAFRFLHLLNGQLREVDAIGHYYVDPTAQPEASINILETVFDLAINAGSTVFTSQTSVNQKS